MSEKYELEIFKNKDNTKYIEFMNKEKQLEKLRKKELEFKKIQDKTLTFNENDFKN